MNHSPSHHLRRIILALTVATTLFTAPTLAQTDNPIPSATTPCKPPADTTTPTTKPCPTHHHTDTSFSLGAFPQLTATRIDNSNNSFLTQSLTPSAGVLATFRQSFRPWLGYSVNVGYTRASEHFTDNADFGSPGTFANFSTHANMYEFSLSYLAQKPITAKLSGFADVGAGMMDFVPTHLSIPTNQDPLYTGGPTTNYRPLGVGGLGIDYLLSPHLSFRAEYRGQLYKFADYGYEPAKHLTVTSEPTFSLVYHFQKTSPAYK